MAGETAGLSARRRLWWERVRLALESLALLRRLVADSALGEMGHSRRGFQQGGSNLRLCPDAWSSC